MPATIRSTFDHFNHLITLDTEENRFRAPAIEQISTPKYLVHCANYNHLGEILLDRRFGGKKVLSGNIYGNFPQTHFSPVPFIEDSGYNSCIVVNSHAIAKHNKKPFVPLLHVQDHRDPLQKKCIYFTDNGWNAIDRDTQHCSEAFVHEKEWNMENPISLNLDTDVHALIFEKRYWKDHEYRLQRDLTRAAVISGMNLDQITTLIKKVHYFTWNRQKKEIQYEEPAFPNTSSHETIIACDKGPHIYIDPSKNMLNDILYGGKRVRESISLIGTCHVVDKNGNRILSEEPNREYYHE